MLNFGFVMYQNRLVHVIMGFKHYVSCIMRIEAPRGHSDTSVNSGYVPDGLIDPCLPFVPPISQYRDMYKSLTYIDVSVKARYANEDVQLADYVCAKEILFSS